MRHVRLGRTGLSVCRLRLGTPPSAFGVGASRPEQLDVLSHEDRGGDDIR